VSGRITGKELKYETLTDMPVTVLNCNPVSGRITGKELKYET